MSPFVTVLMPVYNGEKYLRQAIDSILAQSYGDFEFLIINDGSIDQSIEIVASYNDPRIRLVNNEENLGLIATLNKGLDLAKGKYLARMDCDDISLPERLAEQVKFMEQNETISVCGTWVEMFKDNIMKSQILKLPIHPDELRFHVMFKCALIHPSVIIRLEDFRKHKFYYNDEYAYAEDFELWNRSSNLLSLANIPKVLLRYRLSPEGISRKHYKVQKVHSNKVRKKIYHSLGLKVGEEFDDVYNINIENLRKMHSNLLLVKNRLEERYSNETEKQYIRNALAEEWYELCRNSTHSGWGVWKIFNNSELRKEVPLKRRVKLFIKCVLARETLS